MMVLIAGLGVLLAMSLHKPDRADAAPSSCYADGIGPSTPTICE